MAYKANEQRYDKMKYNRCGNSGLMLPAISLGMWHNFGDDSNFDNAKEMVLGSFDMGITHFDFGNNYGPPPGAAERNFAKILHKELSAHRDELIISTKAGYRMWPGPYGEWGSRKYLLASLDQSLARLGLDYVDIFYSHRFDPDTPLEETVIALAAAVRQGKALYVGISSYNAEQTLRASEMLKKLGCPCLIHQPNYSMLSRWVEDALLDVLDHEGIGCIAFCPLAQGLLTNKYLNGIPEGSRASIEGTGLLKEHVTETVISKVQKLNEMAVKRGQTLAQMSLQWVLRDSRVTSALIGASRLEQIEENVKSLEFEPLSADEIMKINQILSNENIY